MLPKWSDKFSVHHEIIDQQHQKLFELARKVYKIANSHATRGEVKGIITEFFEYMKTHFKDEEQYMAAIGYPQLEEHKKLHRSLVKSMASMIKNIRSVNEIKDKILFITKDWLLKHIVQEDMLIEKYRKESLKASAGRIYIYTCGCSGKEHKLTESMHIFVKNAARKIRCKECQQNIVYQVAQ